MDVLIAEQGRCYERELELLKELNLTRSKLSYLVNRTRAKVLIYRLYDRVTPGWLPRKGPND
jgi:hypothetical protein